MSLNIGLPIAGAATDLTQNFPLTLLLAEKKYLETVLTALMRAIWLEEFHERTISFWRYLRRAGRDVEHAFVVALCAARFFTCA